MDSELSGILKKSLEAVLLPLLALVLLYLWTGAHFDYPWWWLAPLAIALRYGVAYGIGSGLVLIVGYFIEIWFLGVAHTQPGGEIVGGLIATYLAGLYASHSRSRLIEANASLAYLEERLESLTRVFYVTRLSHGRLEENLITKSYDLRTALDAIAAELGKSEMQGTEWPSRPLGHILQLLAYYGRLSTSGIYQVVGDKVQTEPMASLGAPFTLDVHDPLVGGVMEKAQLAYYSVDQILGGQASAYRVVLPMSAADGTLLALIVVVDLPLLAVDEENLLTLAAMTAFVADAMRAGQLSQAVRHLVPTCPSAFALEWIRLGHLRQHAEVHSAWILLTPGHDATAGVIELIDGARRGLDQYWRSPLAPSQPGLMVLLVLAGQGATEGFLQRIDALCREHLGADLKTLNWIVQQGQVRNGSGQELMTLLQRGS
ncbi:MAG: hypothetical protein EPN74_04555 [Rhodanobacter sp.]|nr:MAG: hypothetical protein EPN74_04555 [Rhodanobacter sp.]